MQTEIHIEPNIPIPLSNYCRSHDYAKIISKMNIGDSIKITRHQARTFRAVAFKLNIDMTCRTLEDKHHVRMWRMR